MTHRILNRNFPWPALSRRVQKEQRNRETYSPTVSTYRWWARRSHALVGALIDRSRKVLGDDIVVSDPMAGGGTVAIEAARRGLTMYAQDINPWAAFGLETTLNPIDPALIEKSARAFMEILRRESASLYTTSDGEEIVTQLHVRTCRCPKCTKINFLFPTSLVALDRRITDAPTTGWFGCPACGEVYRAKWPQGRRRCPACEHTSKDSKPDDKRIFRRALECAHCAFTITIEGVDLQNGGWFPALTITADGKKLAIRPATDKPNAPSHSSHLGSRLAVPIPPIGETAALLKSGFEMWADLFTNRQLVIIDKALSILQDVAPSFPVRQRLLLTLAGFAEMAGYACRWDPKYRKVYEVTANHHYARVLLAAETNPLGSLGRGTLERRLDSAIAAARWFSGSTKSKVTCGSSKTQPLPNSSVDLVVTDPPYYDSVQYAELSRLFRTFAEGLGLDWKNNCERREAVASRTLGCTHTGYIRRLEGVFRETARTLKPTGRMLLTFHHGRVKAWEAMARSLRAAKWRIVSVAVVHSENEKDFAKNEKNAMTVDAVFECVRSTESPIRIATALGSKNQLSRNVLAMGCAVAAFVNNAGPSLQSLYLDQIRRRRIRKILIQ